MESSLEGKRRSSTQSKLGKQEVANANIDPMSYRPSVIHKARKVESFIERTEPRLVQQLDSWKDLRID